MTYEDIIKLDFKNPVIVRPGTPHNGMPTWNATCPRCGFSQRIAPGLKEEIDAGRHNGICVDCQTKLLRA